MAPLCMHCLARGTDPTTGERCLVCDGKGWTSASRWALYEGRPADAALLRRAEERLEAEEARAHARQARARRDEDPTHVGSRAWWRARFVGGGAGTAA